MTASVFLDYFYYRRSKSAKWIMRRAQECVGNVPELSGASGLKNCHFLKTAPCSSLSCFQCFWKTNTKNPPKTLIIPYRWFCRFLLSVSMHHKWRILKVSVLSWAYLSYGIASVRALDEQLGHLCFHIHKEINTGPSLFIYDRKQYGFELINIIFEIFQPVEKTNKNQ